MLLENYIHLRDYDIYKHQIYAYQNQLDVIMESQNRIRALRHDMKNHILALQVLVQKKEVEEADNYLDSMQHFMKNPQEYVATGNDTIDSLLNYKIQKAKDVLNLVETKISIPEKLNLHSFDLNVVLGNLLDNAIEAALKAVNKRISVDIYSDEQAMVIKISNTTEENVLKNNPEMNTTKKDNSYHGYGIKNVSELVKKNNGTIEYIQLGVDIGQCRVLLML